MPWTSAVLWLPVVVVDAVESCIPAAPVLSDVAAVSSASARTTIASFLLSERHLCMNVKSISTKLSKHSFYIFHHIHSHKRRFQLQVK